MKKNIHIEANAYQLIKSAEDYLFPKILPFDEGFLPVSAEHSLWFAQYGNKDGVPAVVVHGGPGGGCSPRDMRFFDPSFYRIILFDQRGAGRSTPTAFTHENTTHHLISDMEVLREHLAIDKWLVFGGSWGSALGLAYGEAHPAHSLGFIFRGMFLGTKDEYRRVWYGMGDIYPEAFLEYVEFLPKDERENLIESYYKRLMSDDPKIHMPAAIAFYKYDHNCATLVDKSFISGKLESEATVLSLSRLFAHYSKHEFFFDHDQLMGNLCAISHLPARIVHGRYDVICRLSSAFRLHTAWPDSVLTIVQDAGHGSQEPGIIKALIDATESFKRLF